MTAAAPAAVPATAAAEAAGEPLPSVCGAAAPAHNNKQHIPNTHSHIAAHATTISHNYPSADPTGCAQHTPECVLHAVI